MSKENIHGFDKKKEEESITQSEWAVTPEDLAIIKARLEREQRAMMDVALIQIQLTETVERAKNCRRDREQTCVEIEKKVGVPDGTSWIIDFEKGALVKRA